MLTYPFLKDCRQHCVSLQGGHMSQLDPVTPLSVGAAAAGLTLIDCMICMNMSTRMLDLAPLYRLCPGVASENQITLSSWRRQIMPFYTFQVRFLSYSI